MTSPTEFYYQNQDEVVGPLTGIELREEAFAGNLLPGTRVKIGKAGEWVPARQLRNLFGVNGKPRPHPPEARKLLPEQWFVKHHGRTIGPLSLGELLERVARGNVSPNTQVKRNADGRWGSAEQAGVLSATADSPPAARTATAPNRPQQERAADDGFLQCPECGADISIADPECLSCGATLVEDAEAQNALHAGPVSKMSSVSLATEVAPDSSPPPAAARERIEPIETPLVDLLEPPAQAPSTQAPSTQAPSTQAPSTQAPAATPVEEPVEARVAERVADSIASGSLESEGAASDLTGPQVMPCPDCGGVVSKRAYECPHCGCPVAEIFGAESVAVQQAKRRVSRCRQCENDMARLAFTCPHCGGVTRTLLASAFVLISAAAASVLWIVQVLGGFSDRP